MKIIAEIIFCILFFVFLQYIALSKYFGSDEANYAKNINTINDINYIFSDIVSYFSLQKDNDILAENIAILQAEILRKSDIIEEYESKIALNIDSTEDYRFVTGGRVIYNTIVSRDNIVRINKGSEDGIELDMTAIHNNALLGYVIDVDVNYSTIRTLLSEKISSSGALKKNNSLCSIVWSGESIYKLNFFEMSPYSNVQIGDTVSTASTHKNRFDKNINIGVVSKIEFVQGMYYNGVIDLFSDIKKLEYITIIENQNDDRVNVQNKDTVNNNAKNIEEYE